ncbi:glycerophosphodiester phosphodiesterase [Providencia rettgeri]
MKKIGDVTNTADKNGEFTNGNISTGTPPTILEGPWLTAIQREILNVLVKAGVVQDPNKDNQLALSIEKIAKSSVPKLVQETGSSEDEVMSQKAVTDAISDSQVNVPDASTEIKGKVQLTNDVGDSDKLALTPAGGKVIQNGVNQLNINQREKIPVTDRKLVINAHRGYSETYLEQTLMSYSQCNADAFEIDMQTTSDGVAVCFHDDDLSIQTVTGVGTIKDNTLAEIERLRFKRAQGSRYADMVGIPQLAPVCKMAARRGKKLLAEIKGYRTIDDCIQYNSIITSYGLAPTTTYICFDFAPLRLIREHNAESSYGWIINSYNAGMDKTINELASWGGSVLSINKNALASIGRDRLRVWESMGLTINVWTVYTMQQLQDVLSFGVRHVTLDKDFASILNN